MCLSVSVSVCRCINSSSLYSVSVIIGVSVGVAFFCNYIQRCLCGSIFSDHSWEYYLCVCVCVCVLVFHSSLHIYLAIVIVIVVGVCVCVLLVIMFECRCTCTSLCLCLWQCLCLRVHLRTNRRIAWKSRAEWAPENAPTPRQRRIRAMIEHFGFSSNCVLIMKGYLLLLRC